MKTRDEMDPWFLERGQQMADALGERVYYLESRRNVMGVEEPCSPCLMAASQLEREQRGGPRRKPDWLYEFTPGASPG